MRYYYSTVDKIVLTHSPMLFEHNTNKVIVHFERPNKNGFDFATGRLPECEFDKTYGFSEDELFELTDYLKNNAMLIWDYSQKGGAENA